LSLARVHPVDDERQLAGIKSLQTANLRANLDVDEAAREGFVTAEYTLEYLRAMHDAAPSIVATDGDAVVGYALVADRTIATEHPLLAGLFEATDRHAWHGAPLSGQPYVVCGQLCVARTHRGRGLVDRMYRQFRDVYAARYSHLVTDVASDNPRSLRVHRRVGFAVLATVEYDGADWHVVLWDWRVPPGA
jgi:ribosomal protein S18 acetylase RimI-like enzyme